VEGAIHKILFMGLYQYRKASTMLTNNKNNFHYCVHCTGKKHSGPQKNARAVSVRYHSRLGGVMVSVLAIGPKVRGFKPRQGEEFLRHSRENNTRIFEKERARPSSKRRQK
jgi:hypothetical protein